MIPTLVIFLVSAVFLSIMVLFRVWEIRVGRISVNDDSVPDKLISADKVEFLAEDFFSRTRIFFHHLVAIAFARIVIFVRGAEKEISREWKKISSKLPKEIPRHTNSDMRGGSSVYLKDISAHKEEVRKENGYHGETKNN